MKTSGTGFMLGAPFVLAALVLGTAAQAQT